MKKIIMLAALFCTLNAAFISLAPVVTQAQESPDPAPKPEPDPKPEAL